MTIQGRVWPHFRFDPEVIWEKQDEERDWLFQEWEDREASRENGEKESV